MTTAEILLKAAEILKVRGWNSNGWVGDGDPSACPVCVVAAINLAAGYRFDHNPEADLDTVVATNALAGHLGIDKGDMWAHGPTDALGDHWNDKVATSAEQVIGALRAAAAGQS